MDTFKNNVMTTKEKLKELYYEQSNLYDDLEEKSKEIKKLTLQDFLEDNPDLKIGNILQIEKWGIKSYGKIESHTVNERKDGTYSVVSRYRPILLTGFSKRDNWGNYLYSNDERKFICHESEFLSKCKQYHHFQRFTPKLDGHMLRVLQSLMESEKELV